ncbi:MAG TPA: hypothetical protein VGQ20_14515 [Acidimicrobiales bacterium]|jgi:hypothetical protein|nr:hypothetical protein [Acidimicrobiales bacterium]
MKLARTKLLVPLVLAMVMLGACGSGGKGSGVASLADGASEDTAAKDGEAMTEEETQEAFRQYAACMREHGVDMQDPSADGGGPQVVKPQGGSDGPTSAFSVGGATVTGLSPDDPTFKEADAACKHIIAGVIANARENMDPEELEKMKQQALDFAKCMREHGVDMPDPQFGENGEMTQMMRVDGEDSAQFEQAQEACKQFGPEGMVTKGAPGAAVGSAGSK